MREKNVEVNNQDLTKSFVLLCSLTKNFSFWIKSFSCELKMFKFFVLISAFVLFQVQSDHENLVILCPKGWIASEIIKLKCKYNNFNGGWSGDHYNCLFCMTCRESWDFSEHIQNVEVCLVSNYWLEQRLDGKESKQVHASNRSFNQSP